MPIRDAIVVSAVFMLLTAIFILVLVKQVKNNSPYFTVTEMVQCKGTICNAVLDMDDIAILVPFDSNKVHVGDKIYLVK